jgi:competence protein ComEA
MANNEHVLVDINQASPDELSSLPGIGPGMADRIITGRPYYEVESLLEVQGLGERTLERIRPYIKFGLSQDAEIVDETTDTGTTEAEPKTMDQPGFFDRLEHFAQSSMERFQISSQVVWFVLITGTLSVLLSVFLTLSILAGINRTLNYGRHASVRQMQAEVSNMETTLNGLSSNLASVDQRLQAVEGLSGRMSTLEEDFVVINEDIDQAVSVVGQLSEQVSQVSESVDEMAGTVDRFGGFLDGLQILISDLFTMEDNPASP